MNAELDDNKPRTSVVTVVDYNQVGKRKWRKRLMSSEISSSIGPNELTKQRQRGRRGVKTLQQSTTLDKSPSNVSHRRQVWIVRLKVCKETNLFSSSCIKKRGQVWISRLS